MVLAISAGMRRAEILTLRKAQFDLGRGVISLHETKNGEPRRVPLTGHARDLVAARLNEINDD